MKGGFDAGEQLGEAEAVDREVAVERALEAELEAAAAMRVEFKDEFFDELQEARGDIALRCPDGASICITHAAFVSLSERLGRIDAWTADGALMQWRP